MQSYNFLIKTKKNAYRSMYLHFTGTDWVRIYCIFTSMIFSVIGICIKNNLTLSVVSKRPMGFKGK